MPLDTAHWLADVAEGDPVGPNLETDADFLELERTARGKAEPPGSDNIVVDWRQVEALAVALLERSRDLRVVAQLGVARLHTTGISGFAETMTLMRELVATRWDCVHPQLDPEDDNDPTLRANAIMVIADPVGVQRALRDTTLASAEKISSITWRDIAVQAGVAGIPAIPGRATLTETQIRTTFMTGDRAKIATLRAALAQAQREARAILAELNVRASNCKTSDLEALEKLLRTMLADVDRFAVPPDDAVAEETAASESAAEPVAGAAPSVGRANVTAASLTSVASRADAVRLLELVVQYYQQYEPSSPLPLLIERARRLADKNFLEILRDMAPEGLGQAQNIAGVQNE